MSLLGIIFVLVAIGVILWLVETYLPMDQAIRQILRIVVIIIVVIWLLQVFGVWGSLMSARV